MLVVVEEENKEMEVDIFECRNRCLWVAWILCLLCLNCSWGGVGGERRVVKSILTVRENSKDTRILTGQRPQPDILKESFIER